MSAEILRQAAALMRQQAKAATSGPWRDCPMGSEGSTVLAGGNTITTARKPATCREFADAAHIASWHPAVALAVADQLDAMAAVVDEAAGTPLALVAAGLAEQSIAVARLYLGESA